MNFHAIKLWLRGKKTFITAAIAVLSTIVAWSTDEIGTEVAIQSIVAALLIVFVRLGIITEATNTLNEVQKTVFFAAQSAAEDATERVLTEYDALKVRTYLDNELPDENKNPT